MAQRTLLMKEHVRDPETFETFLAGPHDVEDEQAERLLSYHAGRVEEVEAVATEAAAETARESGVDLTSVEGTGSGGRVTKQDVEKAKK
jgi:pyruvate/2-oxoglutarate dehydrogenase complex dihydrolipoamide acyltransferase (E2) component